MLYLFPILLKPFPLFPLYQITRFPLPGFGLQLVGIVLIQKNWIGSLDFTYHLLLNCTVFQVLPTVITHFHFPKLYPILLYPFPLSHILPDSIIPNSVMPEFVITGSWVPVELLPWHAEFHR